MQPVWVTGKKDDRFTFVVLQPARTPNKGLALSQFADYLGVACFERLVVQNQNWVDDKPITFYKKPIDSHQIDELLTMHKDSNFSDTNKIG